MSRSLRLNISRDWALWVKWSSQALQNTASVFKDSIINICDFDISEGRGILRTETLLALDSFLAHQRWLGLLYATFGIEFKIQHATDLLLVILNVAYYPVNWLLICRFLLLHSIEAVNVGRGSFWAAKHHYIRVFHLQRNPFADLCGKICHHLALFLFMHHRTEPLQSAKADLLWTLQLGGIL